MSQHDFISRRNLRRNHASKLFRRAHARCPKQCLDLLRTDRTQLNGLPLDRLKVITTIAHDHAATGGRRLIILHRVLRRTWVWRSIAPLRVQRLDNGLPVRQETDFISNRERGLETVILDAEPVALLRHLIASAKNLAEALPSFGVHRPSIPLADKAGPFERDDGAACALVQVVLNQLRYEVIAVKADKVVPEARYRVKLGYEPGVGWSIEIVDNNSIHDIKPVCVFF